MPINRALDTYRSFTDILRIIKVSKDSNLIRAALACESNMDILSEEPPINSKNPSTISDWWGYLLNFAHENPLINFASDLFSLKLFKKHFEEANTRSFGNLVMVIKMDKPNQVSYKNLFMLPNTVTCFFQQGQQRSLKTEYLVTLRYPLWSVSVRLSLIFKPLWLIKISR